VDVAFYHATRATADAVVPPLVAKALDAGHRVVVSAANRDRLVALDALLWTFDPASFVPHALDGGEHDDRQPCLLSDRIDAPANGARVALLLDPPLPEAGFDRVLLLFDETSVDAARAAWKAWAGAATYWKQGARGWEKAAAKP
jgi:DNA polymerase-3 subunit chi